MRLPPQATPITSCRVFRSTFGLAYGAFSRGTSLARTKHVHSSYWLARCARVSLPETQWGVWLHAVRPLAQLAELATAAESLGAAAILVADEGTDRDVYVTLAVLAQRTRR